MKLSLIRAPGFFVKTLLALTIWMTFSSSLAGAADAVEIISKMDLLLRGTSSQGSYRMTITDPDWTRTLEFKAWEQRDDQKSYIRILSPAKEAGIVTLKIRNEMWNFLPRVERVIKIPPSMMLQSWMGSDFSNDDVVKASSIVDDYSHTVISEETHGGYPAYKIESIPNAGAPVVWGRIIAWVRQSDSVPLLQEFYDERGELIRALRFSDIRMINGRELPAVWEMVPTGSDGRKTVMEVIDLELNVAIDDNIFSLQNLKRAN